MTRAWGAASTDSFTSDSTSRLQHWATSNGPRSRPSTAKRSASTMRTPASTGSTPNRAKARSRKETEGWTTTVTSPERTRGSSASSTTVRSATVGEPGTA